MRLGGPTRSLQVPLPPAPSTGSPLGRGMCPNLTDPLISLFPSALGGISLPTQLLVKWPFGPSCWILAVCTRKGSGGRWPGSHPLVSWSISGVHPKGPQNAMLPPTHV